MISEIERERLLDAFVRPQPNPENVRGSESVTDSAIADFQMTGIREPMRVIFNNRRDFGVKKYGVELLANNGRNAAYDMCQEIADAYLYAKQARIEGKLHAHIFDDIENLLIKLVVFARDGDLYPKRNQKEAGNAS